MDLQRTMELKLLPPLKSVVAKSKCSTVQIYSTGNSFQKSWPAKGLSCHSLATELSLSCYHHSQTTGAARWHRIYVCRAI